jgi:hypothetical protein
MPQFMPAERKRELIFKGNVDQHRILPLKKVILVSIHHGNRWRYALLQKISYITESIYES